MALYSLVQIQILIQYLYTDSTWIPVAVNINKSYKQNAYSITVR